MALTKTKREHLLVECEEFGEHRSVIMIEGPSLALFERSRGPVTEIAYGAMAHGHKMLCDWGACERVFGVPREEVAGAMKEFFTKDVSGDVQLSDVMDLFDCAGERYTYAAWTEQGDVAYRR